MGEKKNRPSVSDLLRLVRVPGGFDPAGQSVSGGYESQRYQNLNGKSGNVSCGNCVFASACALSSADGSC